METPNVNAVIVAAFVRGLIVAVASGLAAGAAALASGSDERTAIIAGVGAGAAAVIVRFGGEGTLDASRAKKGEVWPSDVGTIH